MEHGRFLVSEIILRRRSQITVGEIRRQEQVSCARAVAAVVDRVLLQSSSLWMIGEAGHVAAALLVNGGGGGVVTWRGVRQRRQHRRG